MSVQLHEYRMYLSVGMTHKPTIERLVEIFGGKVYAQHDKRYPRTIWVWRICARQHIQRVLSLIRPWLVTKAAEADVFLAFLAQYPQGREATHWKLKELKRG